MHTYTAERRRLNAERSRARRDVERQLTETKRRQTSVIRMIEDEQGDRKLLGQRLKELAAIEVGLEIQMRQMDRPDVAELHPSAAARYRQQVADIQAELAKGDRHALEAVAFVRGLIRTIKMTPEPNRWDLQVVGDLAVLLELERGGNAADFLGGCGGRI